MFANRIAKDTPSGYEPKYLISEVIKPIKTPKINLPNKVDGEVT